VHYRAEVTRTLFSSSLHAVYSFFLGIMTKATTMHRQADCDLAVTSITRRPRAIVVMVGEDLDHYAELYHTLECSTIAVETMTSAPEYEPTDVAISVLRETARLIRMAQLSEMGMGNVPVMLHVIGNSAVTIIEEMERQVEVVLNEASNIVCPHPSSASRTLFKNMNASTRSLFTTDTEPMSSDDEDDESGYEESTMVETSPPLPSPCSPLQSSLTLRRRPRTSPSVHRIDMERTGISLQHSLNPEERAYRRDSEMFCSHMNMVLWDMPPPKRVDIMTQILIFLVSIWNGFLQILFWGNRSSRRQAFPGMSLANEHALMYTSDNQDVVLGLLQETTLIMNAKLHGSRKQHGAQYVAFVRETLDRISPPLSNEEDGFSSDEGE
jgi:hypothetical protein